MTRCPFCSSDKVYRLLNTLRCKRCRNIWKEGEEDPYTCGSPPLGTSLKIRKRTDPLETRMEKKLNECLTRSGGECCIPGLTLQARDISQEMFRKYLRKCVKDRALAEKKDSYGRTWYFRPG
jgi:hypothetical protein